MVVRWLTIVTLNVGAAWGRSRSGALWWTALEDVNENEYDGRIIQWRVCMIPTEQLRRKIAFFLLMGSGVVDIGVVLGLSFRGLVLG